MYRRYKRYSGDPRWTLAKFTSTCYQCNKGINRGEEIYYYPNGKRVLCKNCGKLANIDFNNKVEEEKYC